MKTFKKNKKNITYKKKYSNFQRQKKLKFTKLKGKNKNKYSKIKGGSRNLFANIKKDTLASGSNIERSSITRKPIAFTHQPVPISKLETASNEREEQLKKKNNIKSEIDKVFNDLSNIKRNQYTNQPYKEFELIEVTNTFFQIKYNYYNDQGEYKPLFFFVNPDILSVDKLQYFINNQKLTINNNNNNIQISENTITLKSLRSGGHYRTSGVFETILFKNVYEDSKISLVSYEENLEYLRDPTNGKYHINVMGIEYDPPNSKKESLIVEDIAWINEIMLELSRVNPELNNLGENKTNLELFLEKSKTPEGKDDYNPRIFSCVDLDVDHSKIIIEEYNLVDGEEYVIVGYPKDTMRPYLDLYNKNKEMFDSIYGVHKREFMKYMAELHNNMYPDKTIDTSSKEALEKEIHKFYGKKDYFDYIINLNKDIETDFRPKFTELHKLYCNNLAKHCLNKPMMQIQYVFLIFKNNTDGNYIPAVFNFRELTHKHHPLLQRLEIVIKSVLPNRYGITDSEAEEYKLWYSHYNYGDVFHIKTEYFHTMSNIHQQAYKYPNSITLEELIYMLSTEGTDLKNLRVEYQRKKVNFKLIDGIEQIFHEGLATQTGVNTTYKIYIEPLSTDLLDLSTFLNSNILLMFVQTGKLYTFVYKKDDKFYIIKFKPSIYNIITKIFDTLQKHILKAEFLTKLLSSRNSEFIESIDISGIDLYEVVEHRLITNNNYSKLMQYNPLLVKQIMQTPLNTNIDIRYFFQNSIFQIKELYPQEIIIPNPYLKKPLILYYILNTQVYKREHTFFILNYNKNNKYEYEYNTQEDINVKIKNYNKIRTGETPIPIKRIFFNPNNCGYNLIQIDELTKNVIWVVPLNSTSIENINESINISKYLGNITDLNFSHLTLLKFINSLNFNQRKCYINSISITPTQFCLHIHVIDKENYKTSFASFEQGGRLNSMISISYIINVLNLNNNYFNNYKVNLITHEVH
jgi:hypothetical protein